MILLLVLGLAGAGAGFYLFYWLPMQESGDVPPVAEEAPSDEVVEEPPQVIQEVITDYYVNTPTLGVRERPDREAFIERLLYRGAFVKILEQRDGWGRISVYYVYEDGGEEIAEWIPMEGLVEEAPVITKEERQETLTAYIDSSDDFNTHEVMFLTTTDALLKDETCTPGDFEELGGWVRSIRYSERDVYFVYCGGMKQADKIYLDVNSGETFYK
ncbi:SH3 domain-containing protein [Vibrio genomosp. F10]|uniref:SH3b domain-containing protein n=2 Tax=Vibrio genomosp. F10 TaxID=723171 RepID=A0A1B9R043_9VIBR|nr:SH3 domain-containing protein [Vibrio genomosp. F10]OCH77072.1 hypothetical protein A6E14_08265 [Vibrio genomosp. F10]OEE32715.1 hypothetical protein A1QO_11205 [Vibrio genomosp. F10 str. ZF-129]OEE94351.1 hypothetical protein A1QM_06775 [Vibrio genomosp. F10 str. 9ZC157]OEE95369.1 hypothetical protein A1QK_15335 [Vibrio genomosp. F10 str. 9ZD137]